MHNPKHKSLYFDCRKYGLIVCNEHSYSEMIKKIDEESHQTEQDQKCISFNTYVALLIHFFQFLKNCMIHLAL